jgi:hypothetical protein
LQTVVLALIISSSSSKLAQQGALPVNGGIMRLLAGLMIKDVNRPGFIPVRQGLAAIDLLDCK